jgi:BirA family biotin operon repressor/biotin-[acetyl-CoA-carboxylase] ligase
VEKSEALLRILADGRFHSGEQIAQSLDCSRSAVWKRLAQLRKMPGLEIDSVTGRGYRLRQPLELLDRQRILDGLSEPAIKALRECHVLGSVGSTNALAMQQIPETGHGVAWFAEHQSAGRGRRGRTWVSPYGRNIYFSLAWQFNASLAEVSGLSIAAGAVLAKVLHAQGLRGHGLKWPNDLLWQERKLGGILLEAQGEAAGPAGVVIGIGINLDIDQKLHPEIDQPFTSLKEAGVELQRNRLAAHLLESMIELCQRFSQEGLEPFLDAWRSYDVFAGRPVRLLGTASEIAGISLGLAADGGLRLRTDDHEKTFYAGEISMKVGD